MTVSLNPSDMPAVMADLLLACTCPPDAFGAATAAKRGRNPKFPYVPIINHDPAGTAWKARTEQIRNRAYADRQDAIDCAQRVIDNRRACHIRDLNEYRNRATREAEGLPRELADALGLATRHNDALHTQNAIASKLGGAA